MVFEDLKIWKEGMNSIIELNYI